MRTPLLEFRPVSAVEPQEMRGGLPEPSELPRERWWEASDLSWDADNRPAGDEGTPTIDPVASTVASTARQEGTTPDGASMGSGTDEPPRDEQTPLEQRAADHSGESPAGERPGPFRSWWNRARTHRTRDEPKAGHGGDDAGLVHDLQSR